MKDINLKNLIIAHRGIHNNLNIPENSIIAFKGAIDKNIPIEIDVHLTKDNKLVVFHDNNLFRMTGVNKLIRKCNYNDLQKLRLLNTNQKIPLLEEVLELVNNKVLIDIEIKNDKRITTTVNKLINLLDNYKGPFIIQSFYLKYLFFIKQKRRNYTICILVNNIKYFCYKLIDSKFVLEIVKPDFIAYNKNLVMCSKVKKIRNRGIPIFAWTIKNKNEKETTFKYADSLISEYFE